MTLPGYYAETGVEHKEVCDGTCQLFAEWKTCPKPKGQLPPPIQAIADITDQHDALEKLWAVAYDMTGALGLNVIVQDGEIVIQKESWQAYMDEKPDRWANVLAVFRQYNPDWNVGSNTHSSID